MGDFKYQDLIDDVISNGCPCEPHTFQLIDRDTYRYVFEAEEARNHIPNRKSSPNRILPDDSQYCSTCGLSCYHTIETAVEFYTNLLKTHPKIYKAIGDGLAHATLIPKHGRMSEIDDHGHFDFFEFDTFDPHTHFTFLHKLI